MIDGQLEVGRHGTRIAELGRGDIVGEIGVAVHRLRTGTVTATTPLEMLHLTHAAFEELYDGMPAFRKAVDTTVEQRLAELDEPGRLRPQPLAARRGGAISGWRNGGTARRPAARTSRRSTAAAQISV